MKDKRLLVIALVPPILWIGLLLVSGQTFWSLVFDDSFYYWQIARNIAAGAGSTFDGLHQTNGYHPLWLLFCVGLYAVGLTGELAPMVALVVQVLLFGFAWSLLAAAVLGVLAEVPNPPLRRTLERTVLGFLLVLGCLQPLVKVWVNGLESTFVLLCQVLLLGLLLRTGNLLAPSGRATRLLCGVLIALGFLARTDGALMLPAIALWSLPSLRRDLWGSLAPLLELVAIPTAVVVGYMVANQAVFGSAIQVSGLLKSPSPDLWRVAGALLVVALPTILVRRLDVGRWPRLALAVTRTRPFGLFALLLIAYYGLLQVFPRVWYFGPALLYLVLLACAVLADLLALAMAESPNREQRGFRTLTAVLGVVGVALVGVGIQQALTAPGAAPMLASRDAGRYIGAELPADAILASWDAGVLGYYSERRVVNLDGVVSSAGYLAALREGRTAEFLADVPIGWVANHAATEDLVRTEAVAVLGPRADGLEVVRAWPFEVFAGVNQALPDQQELAVYLMALK